MYLIVLLVLGSIGFTVAFPHGSHEIALKPVESATNKFYTINNLTPNGIHFSAQTQPSIFSEQFEKICRSDKTLCNKLLKNITDVQTHNSTKSKDQFLDSTDLMDIMNHLKLDPNGVRVIIIPVDVCRNKCKQFKSYTPCLKPSVDSPESTSISRPITTITNKPGNTPTPRTETTLTDQSDKPDDATDDTNDETSQTKSTGTPRPSETEPSDPTGNPKEGSTPTPQTETTLTDQSDKPDDATDDAKDETSQTKSTGTPRPSETEPSDPTGNPKEGSTPTPRTETTLTDQSDKPDDATDDAKDETSQTKSTGTPRPSETEPSDPTGNPKEGSTTTPRTETPSTDQSPIESPRKLDPLLLLHFVESVYGDDIDWPMDKELEVFVRIDNDTKLITYNTLNNSEEAIVINETEFCPCANS